MAYGPMMGHAWVANKDFGLYKDTATPLRRWPPSLDSTTCRPATARILTMLEWDGGRSGRVEAEEGALPGGTAKLMHDRAHLKELRLLRSVAAPNLSPLAHPGCVWACHAGAQLAI